MEITYEVGTDIVSWCTKCKLMLDHIISALVDELPKKVKCKTCNGHHNYREAEPVKKTPGTRKTKKSEYQVLMAKAEEAGLSATKKYSTKANFKANQMIEHATFGTGFIGSVINRSKVDIIFETGTKRMVQNR